MPKGMENRIHISRDTFWGWYRKSEFGRQAGYSPRDFAARVYYKGFISDKEERTGRTDKVFVDIQAIESSIHRVWEQIAWDVERNYELTTGQPVPNIVCVETVLDSDHLKTFDGDCGAEASAVIDKAIAQFGYAPVLRYITDHIHLR